MWTITSVNSDDGRHLFYTVSTVSNGDAIHFTLDSERDARELRDVLNRIGTSVTSFAL